MSEARERNEMLKKLADMHETRSLRVLITEREKQAIRQLLDENVRAVADADAEHKTYSADLLSRDVRIAELEAALAGYKHVTAHCYDLARDFVASRKEKDPSITTDLDFLVGRLLRELSVAEAALAAKDAEIERLKKLLDRDHTGLASGINAMRQVFRSYGWLPAGEWGSYEWNERTEANFRAEVGRAFDEAERIGDKALRESGIRANAAFYPERDELTAERAAREQAERERDNLAKGIEQVAEGARQELAALTQARDIAAEQAAEAERQLEQVQAACAAMREVLSATQDTARIVSTVEWAEKRKAALATNAGAALLDELARLREALHSMIVWFGKPKREEWMNQEAFASAASVVSEARAALAKGAAKEAT